MYTGAIGFVGRAPTPLPAATHPLSTGGRESGLPAMGRGRYAQFSVAIRTAVVDRGTGGAEYGVGGGVVWDSTAADEYAETRHKARVLTETAQSTALQEFALLESLRLTPEEGYWLLEYHLRRLRDSADYFDFVYEQARVVEELERFATTLDGTGYKVRLLLARDGAVTM